MSRVAVGTASLVLIGVGVAAWWGAVHGPADLVFLVCLVSGLVLPVVAALRLLASAARDRTQWLALVSLVALGSATAAGFAWVGRGSLLHLLCAVLALFAVGLVGLVTLVLDLVGKYREPVVADRRLDLLWGWRTIAFGFLLVLSYPAGSFLQSRDVRRAKAWVEKAAAEVRAETARAGRAPHSLREILGRLPAPPRLVLLDEGYTATPDGASFEFQVEDPTQMFDGVWIYQGNGGHWRQEGD